MIFASAFVAPALCSSWDFVERLRAPRNLPKINLGLDRCPAIEAGAYATILSHCHVFVGPRLRASTARVLRAGTPRLGCSAHRPCNTRLACSAPCPGIPRAPTWLPHTTHRRSARAVARSPPCMSRARGRARRVCGPCDAPSGAPAHQPCAVRGRTLVCVCVRVSACVCVSERDNESARTLAPHRQTDTH